MPNLLIVEDSRVALSLLEDFLREAGHGEIMTAGSVEEAFRLMCVIGGESSCAIFDLILMDVRMPGKNGLQACRELRELERFRDVPIIVMSAEEDLLLLQAAFDAGASDFIAKPVRKVELLARVRAALRLKEETDRRKAREAELLAVTGRLEEANRCLEAASSLDGLTGIANRRALDAHAAREWARCAREALPFSLIMIDIDFFKLYNDTYGHLEGDECLKRVAAALHREIHRPADLLARFGGEEFIAVLPETELQGAAVVAETMRKRIEDLEIEHSRSPTGRVTISLGVASSLPHPESCHDRLVEQADRALYAAKNTGRNTVTTRGAAPES